MNKSIYNKYMNSDEAKRAIIDIGKRMYNRNFVAANDGNISIKIGENEIWVTPTGVSKGYMTEDMLVKIDLNGNVLQGKSKPSSEVKMHLRLYQENPAVKAVTHAHPVFATSYSIAGIALDQAYLPEAVVNLGIVPVAAYSTPGSSQVPESIAPFCRTHNAVLLSNHGALTWGESIEQAFFRLESLEHYAQILMVSSSVIKKAAKLTKEQVAELILLRESLGITTGGIPLGI